MTYEPYFHVGCDRPSTWLVTCDHASNKVPSFIAGGDLGISADDMSRHIAFDIGAAGVATELAAALDAPAVLSNFSRLVIDPNRGEDDPTLIMKLYDGTIIPANRSVSLDDREARLTRLYRPYDLALKNAAARQSNTAIVSVHSFTPQLNGRQARPWHIGLLYADDDRLAKPLLRRLQSEADLKIGDNEPYVGHLPGDAVDRHALTHGRPNILIELRSDLIETRKDQVRWAKRLAPVLDEVRATAQL